jgi:hypothetical protein
MSVPALGPLRSLPRRSILIRLGIVVALLVTGLAVRASGVLANQVAEHTVALLTGLLRNLPTFFRAQQQREYIRRPTRDHRQIQRGGRRIRIDWGTAHRDGTPSVAETGSVS